MVLRVLLRNIKVIHMLGLRVYMYTIRWRRPTLYNIKINRRLVSVSYGNIQDCIHVLICDCYFPFQGCLHYMLCGHYDQCVCWLRDLLHSRSDGQRGRNRSGKCCRIKLVFADLIN